MIRSILALAIVAVSIYVGMVAIGNTKVISETKSNQIEAIFNS